MSACLFGGSFNLVESNDRKLKNMFVDTLTRIALVYTLPFTRWLPTVRKSTTKMRKFLDEIILKRQREIAEIGKTKNDLMQIFIDNNEANPVEFSRQHLREAMTLFM